MTQRNTRMFAGVAGTALLLTGSGLALNALNPNSADASDAASGTTHSFNENVVEASWVNVDDGSYVRVPNVQGSFVFNQLGTTPNDELFNVFGAALTSMCSKPAVEFEAQTGGVANFYVNVGGHIKKNFTVDVSELSEDASEEALMACSCATGSPFGQAAVLGVPLASIVEMADLEEGVNTVTAYGADGFGQPLPLRYALEHDAMLVYQVNGQELASATDGSSMQLWMPETVARYFTRNITDIELTREDAEPDVQQVDPCYRNKMHVRRRRRDHVRGRCRRSGKPDRGYRVFVRRRRYLDVVRDRGSNRGQMGELAVLHFVRGCRRLSYDGACQNCRRHGFAACGDAVVPGLVRGLIGGRAI